MSAEPTDLIHIETEIKSLKSMIVAMEQRYEKFYSDAITLEKERCKK